MAERWTCIFRKSINLNALLLQEKLPVQYCYFSYDPVTTIIYTAQIQPLAQFSTLRQSWFVVLLGLRSLWTLDVICKILCTPIFAKIALWSDEVALAIFGWKYNCEIELIYWERLFPSWFPSRHKEDETKPLRITQANVCKNTPRSAPTNNPQCTSLSNVFHLSPRTYSCSR